MAGNRHREARRAFHAIFSNGRSIRILSVFPCDAFPRQGHLSFDRIATNAKEIPAAWNARKEEKKGNKVFLSAFYSLQFAVLYVADTGKTTAAALYTNVEWERERERSIQGRQSASSVFF